MKLTLREIIGINAYCKSPVMGQFEGVRWGNFLAQNEFLTKNRADAWAKQQQENKKWAAYVDEHNSVIEEFGVLDDNGNKIILNSDEENHAKLAEVDKKHKDLIAEFDTLLDEEVEISLDTIHIDHLPLELKRDHQRPIVRLIIKE